MTDPNNAAWAALKSLSHAIGRKIWLSRIAESRVSVIGVHYWTSQVVDYCITDGWAYDIPDESNVRRRINYLAEDGLWQHVGDVNDRFNDLIPRLKRKR